MEATELIPEIKALFATGCVDRSVTGDCDTVIHDIADGSKFRNVNRYKFPISIKRPHDSGCGGPTLRIWTDLWREERGGDVRVGGG